MNQVNSDTDDINKLLQDVNNTKLFFTDLNGKLMNLTINKEKLDEIRENGVGFDGSSIAGYATVEKSDLLLMPDMSTYKNISFRSDPVGFFIANVYNEQGAPASTDPRNLLQKIITDAEEEFGFKFVLGPEYEFFLLNDEDTFSLSSGKKFNREAHSDKAGYFHSTPHDKGEFIRNRVVEILGDCGVRYEKSHHEVTPSQHEINIECSDALSAADRTILFTYITQKVAEKNGYYATFMPAPFEGFNRSAFHIHLSVQDQSGKNIFYDKNSDQDLSKIARQFIGGLLKYARETSVIMNSTVNSYKTFVIDREVPIVRGWGFRNRTSMVRVPYSRSPQSTRIELRSPDPAGNVYLQMAVLISMGLQGIREELSCGSPDKGSTYGRSKKVKVWDEDFLPRCLYEALVEAEKSDFLKSVLGEHLYTNFMDLKINEWEEDRTHITSREHRRYLNI
ncbi:MAG: glutamine synthetase family protein [Desulfobacterales bacterium]|nr:glutamine synthetase family protein [Desulfobacterales bacterium]